RPIGARRQVRRKQATGRAVLPVAAEQRFEEAALLVGGCGVLRSAIVLRQRTDHGRALRLAVAGAAALQPVEVGEQPFEIGPRLLDLLIERRALRVLPAEQREEAAAL